MPSSSSGHLSSQVLPFELPNGCRKLCGKVSTLIFVDSLEGFGDALVILVIQDISREVEENVFLFINMRCEDFEEAIRENRKILRVRCLQTVFDTLNERPFLIVFKDHRLHGTPWSGNSSI